MRAGHLLVDDWLHRVHRVRRGGIQHLGGLLHVFAVLGGRLRKRSHVDLMHAMRRRRLLVCPWVNELHLSWFLHVGHLLHCQRRDSVVRVPKLWVWKLFVGIGRVQLCILRAMLGGAVRVLDWRILIGCVSALRNGHL